MIVQRYRIIFTYSLFIGENFFGGGGRVVVLKSFHTFVISENVRVF